MSFVLCLAPELEVSVGVAIVFAQKVFRVAADRRKRRAFRMQKLYILTLMYFLVYYIPLKALKTKVEV